MFASHHGSLLDFKIVDYFMYMFLIALSHCKVEIVM